MQEPPKLGFTAKIVEVFLTSKLSLLFLIGAILAGLVALYITPREEEPQIIVPLADVMVQVPGASAAEVEKLVSAPLERLLWEVDGVEYVYSMSQRDFAIVTVRFFVGEDREDSLVKLYNKIWSHSDKVPKIVKGWVIKPIEIDDVPILTLTFFSPDFYDYDLRRIAEEVAFRLQEVTNTSKINVVGGRRRQIKVMLDPQRVQAYNLTPLEVAGAIRGSNLNLQAGSFLRDNKEILLEVGPFLTDVEEVSDVVVGVFDSKPIYVRDIAEVIDGPEEVKTYTRIGFGGATDKLDLADDIDIKERYQSVTVSVAKRKGTNAVRVADEVLNKVEEFKGVVIPEDVNVIETRNYGETANEKVNELVKHLLVAIATIIVLIALTLGGREAFIVALAVPMTLAITLLGDLLIGYTINRVTLFALILSLGLLVDDPIVDVENIHRHFKLKLYPPLKATLIAVDEVRPPTILATFTVIVSFLPLFFVTGMMGPYMKPMPFNVPLAMIVSLIVAFTVTPWATYHLLKGEYEKESKPYDLKSSGIYKLYNRLMRPFLESRSKSWLFLLFVIGALVISMALAGFRIVPLKMLPFDNKNELQILVDTPEGTTLEGTNRVICALENYLQTVPEVRDFESYVGTNSPFDFNGLVRHYYLREGDNVADIRVNLAPKHDRKQQSHEIALRLRPEIERIANVMGAKIKILESPPGPPVLSTIVGEIYGTPDTSYEKFIEVGLEVEDGMKQVPFVVDIDTTIEASQEKYIFVVDREKASLHGINAKDIVETVNLAFHGMVADVLHKPEERGQLKILLQFPIEKRITLDDVRQIHLKDASSALVPIGELGNFEKSTRDYTIYHKNLKRVTYVMAEMAGESPVEGILGLIKYFKKNPLPEGFYIDWAGEGEWKITLDTFRDMGIAFAAALILIYILLVAQLQSLGMPLVIMVAIPLTLIGIMPGFLALNILFSSPVGDYPNPIFFTATGMIGLIALAGIVVRNSIILIDFIQLRLKEGMKLEEAIIETGAVRFRPIMLTAGAAMFGAWVIVLDPIFSGLAWSFIFGIFASTMFTLMVVPIIFYMVYGRKGKGTDEGVSNQL